MLIKKYKKGSVIAITLIYISLLLIAVVALFFGITQLIRIEGLAKDNLQAGYTAESGIELGLLAISLREAGYQLPKKDIALTSDDTMHIDISYRNTLPLGVTISDPAHILSAALYYDNGTKIIDNDGTNDTYLTLQSNLGKPDCAKVRLIGKNSTGEYDSISSTERCYVREAKGTACLNNPTYTCDDPLPGISFDLIKDTSARNSSSKSSQTFKEFINTHTENKIEVKALDASSTDPVFVGLYSPGRTQSSYQYSITSKGEHGRSSVQQYTTGIQESPLSIATFSVTNR